MKSKLPKVLPAGGRAGSACTDTVFFSVVPVTGHGAEVKQLRIFYGSWRPIRKARRIFSLKFVRQVAQGRPCGAAGVLPDDGIT